MPPAPIGRILRLILLAGSPLIHATDAQRKKVLTIRSNKPLNPVALLNREGAVFRLVTGKRSKNHEKRKTKSYRPILCTGFHWSILRRNYAERQGSSLVVPRAFPF